MAETSKEVQEHYLTEAALQLRRGGFEVGEIDGGYLPVSWEGRHLCLATGGGGARYRAADIEGDERNDAFHKLLDITGTVWEYVRLMAPAPVLEASHLHEDYKLLAEFNGVVLAGHKFTDAPGYQFTTWERDYDGSGVNHGHYTQNFLSAKADFATRSGLVQKERLFTNEQMAELYRCIDETLDSEYPITPDREKLLRDTAKQIEYAVPDLEQRVELSNQKELEYAEQCGQGQMMV